MADQSGQTVKLEETFTLLDSRELSVVEGIRHLITEHLSSGKEPWLVTALVDYFYATGSATAKDLLAEIREPLDKILTDKIQEGLRSQDTKIHAMQLLLYVVDRQPPWAHCLVERPIFAALLKYLKTELDIPMLMSGIMVVVILLPVVPVSIGVHLQEVFDIFARVSGLVFNKPPNAPDVFMLHLHVGVYVLFLRLYGMYPCTFIKFLRDHFTKKENLMVYSDVIQPMLEKVRFNPLLVAGLNDTETAKSRWRKMEPQDIVVSCAKMSLDPIEGTIEELKCPIIPQPPHDFLTTMKPPAKPQKPLGASWQEKMEKLSEMMPVVIDPASYSFSPSLMLGLSTPPTSQRATPAQSFVDLTASLQHSAGGTHSVSPQVATPVPEAAVKEMPVMAEEADRMLTSTRVTPVTPRTGSKTTPVQLNRTQGSSAFTTPITHPPTTSQPPSVGPSPMKFLSSSDSPVPADGQVSDSGAARTLTFDRPPEGRINGAPKHVSVGVERESGGGAGAAGPVPFDSLPSFIRSLSAQDADPLDQEVSQITEVEGLAPNGYPHTVPGASSNKSGTPESLKRFMKKVNRIRFNSLTSHISEPGMFVVAERTIHGGRARSCPPLRRKPLPPDPRLQPCPNYARGFTNGSKLDTVSESAVVLHTGKSDCACGGGGVGGAGEASFTSQDLQHRLSGSKEGSEASSSAQTKTGPFECGNGARLPPYVLDLAHIFRCLFVPVKMAVCRNCQRSLLPVGGDGGEVETVQHGAVTKVDGAWTPWGGPTRSLCSAMSPAELLDRFMIQGKELHMKELSHIPLASGEGVSWSHFGGGPPADEVNILRGQKLMLLNQVMYERHKRSNHAVRNRRLLKRIAHVSALEEQVQALAHELEMKKKDIQNLEVSLKLLQDHNHKLMQTKDSDEYEKLVDFKTTIQQNKDLQEGNVELKNLLLSQKAENDELKKELQTVRAKCFELEKSNDMLHGNMQSAAKWKTQVVELQKELLLMGEAHERLQNQIQQQQRVGHENSRLASEMVILALKAENKELKRERTHHTMTMDAARLRQGEWDESSKMKDLATKEVKASLEAAKATFAEENKALDDKYQAMLRLNNEMGSQMLSLQADNDCMHQKIASLQLRLSRYQQNDNSSHSSGSPHSHKSSPSPSCKDGRASVAESVRSENLRSEQNAKKERNGGSRDRTNERGQEGGGGGGGEESQVAAREQQGVGSREVLREGGGPPSARTVSQDSGHGSLTASGQTAKCDPDSALETGLARPEPRQNQTLSSDVHASLSGSPKRDSSALSETSSSKIPSGKSSASSSTLTGRSPVCESQNGSGSLDKQSADCKPLSARKLGGADIDKMAECGDAVKEKRGDAGGDGASGSSDAAQGLEESRAMLYTDSEDGSQSSFSNFTTDSGIDSKATN